MKRKISFIVIVLCLVLTFTTGTQAAEVESVRFEDEKLTFKPEELEKIFPWGILAEKIEIVVKENDIQPDEYDDLDFGFGARNIIAQFPLNDFTCSYYNFEFSNGKLIKIKVLLQTKDPDGPQPDRKEVERAFESIKEQFHVDKMRVDDSSLSAEFHKKTYYRSANYTSDTTCLAIWGHRATDKSAAFIGIELKDRKFFEEVEEVYPERPEEAYGQSDDEEFSSSSDSGKHVTPTPTVMIGTPTPMITATPIPMVELDETELPILPIDLLNTFIWNSSLERVESSLNSGKIVPKISPKGKNYLKAEYDLGDWKLIIEFSFAYSGAGLISMTYTISPANFGRQPSQEEIERMVEYFKSQFSLSGMSRDLTSNTAQIYGWTCWKSESYKDSSKMLSFFGHRNTNRSGAYFGVYLSSTYYHDSINPIWNPQWELDAYGQIDYEDYEYPELPDDISREDLALFAKSGRLNIPMAFENPNAQPKACFWVETLDNYTFRVVYPRIKTTSFYPISVRFNKANPNEAETLVYNYRIYDFHNSCNGCSSPTDSVHGIGVVSGEGSIRLQPGRYCVYLKNDELLDFDRPPYLTTIPDYSWCQATPKECNSRDMFR